jgi:hypothetical protein
MQADSSRRFISQFDLSLTRLQTNVKSSIESLGCFSLAADMQCAIKSDCRAADMLSHNAHELESYTKPSRNLGLFMQTLLLS